MPLSAGEGAQLQEALDILYALARDAGPVPDDARRHYEDVIALIRALSVARAGQVRRDLEAKILAERGGPDPLIWPPPEPRR